MTVTAHKIPFRSTRQLIGLPVRDLADEVVGRVSDLIVDTDEGRVAYIGISLEGASGGGRRRVVVPWSAMTEAGADRPNLKIAARRTSLDRMARPTDGED